MADLSQLNVNNTDYNLKDAAARNDIRSTQTVSGNPITLTDAAPINAESLVVELEPKQDLHGQSYPYVGGAGKNKLPMTVERIKADNTFETWSGNSYTLNGVTFTILTDNANNVTGIKVNGTASAKSVFNISKVLYLPNDTYRISGCPSGGSPSTYRIADTYTGYFADYGSGTSFTSTNARIDCVIEIGSGYTADNLIFYPMIRLSTETDPTFAPYSNICPITGYIECEVDDVGKNRIPMTVEGIKTANTGGSWNGNTYSYHEGTFTILTDNSGNVTGIKADGTFNTNTQLNLTPYPYSENVYKTYILNGCSGGSNTTYSLMAVYSNDGIDWASEVHVTDTSVTMSSSYDYMRISIIVRSGYTANNLLFKPMLRLSTETDPTFAPYHSSNATIQFGQTVYVGRSNFTEGGTSDEQSEIILNGTETPLGYNFAKNYVQYRFSALGDDAKDGGDLVCNRYKTYIQGSGSFTDGIQLYKEGGYNRILIRDSRFGNTITTLTEWQTWLTSNNLQIVYEKATPTQLSTPPTDLKLLKGTNNLSTNGTTITLGYQPDNVIGEVKGEIQKITEMPYLRILDNDVDTEVKNYRLYYRLISSSYTLVNLAEMLQHRFLFVEIIQNPSGTANHTLLHSALIDPRTIDGFEYQMKAGTGDTVIIESNIAENKFDLSVRYTGTHTSGDPTDYYVTIRLVD